MSFFDTVAQTAEEERKYFENYMEYAKLIRELAEDLLGNAEVYVFGSIVEGKSTPASDIDILVVSENTPKRQSERAKIVGEIIKAIDVFAPFEIHLINYKELEWYEKFIGKKIGV
ncbi:MAG: nucleotidyltransferase domain-containing protein [Archaeoglobaceae archaeon]